jgi:hypothetical protein
MSDLAAEAERLEQLAPGYLARVRAAAAARGLAPTPAGRARQAVDLLDQTARISPDVPLASANPLARVLKLIVNRLVRWYMIYITDQATELGVSVSWVGRAMLDYIGRLESEVAGLRREVEELKAARGF